MDQRKLFPVGSGVHFCFEPGNPDNETWTVARCVTDHGRAYYGLEGKDGLFVEDIIVAAGSAATP